MLITSYHKRSSDDWKGSDKRNKRIYKLRDDNSVIVWYQVSQVSNMAANKICLCLYLLSYISLYLSNPWKPCIGGGGGGDRGGNRGWGWVIVASRTFLLLVHSLFVSFVSFRCFSWISSQCYELFLFFPVPATSGNLLPDLSIPHSIPISHVFPYSPGFYPVFPPGFLPLPLPHSNW